MRELEENLRHTLELIMNLNLLGVAHSPVVVVTREHVDFQKRLRSRGGVESAKNIKFDAYVVICWFFILPALRMIQELLSEFRSTFRASVCVF